MPEIQSGTYIITNIQEPGEVFRAPFEDLSPFPKPVYRLKSGLDAPGKVSVVFMCSRDTLTVQNIYSGK